MLYGNKKMIIPKELMDNIVDFKGRIDIINFLILNSKSCETRRTIRYYRI